MRTAVFAAALALAPVAADVDCGGGASCPTGNTCCRNGSGGFSCCPVVDASCCPDYVHCCPPEHPVCDLSTGSCTARSMQSMLAGKVSRVPWLTKAPSTRRPPVSEEEKEQKKINTPAAAAKSAEKERREAEKRLASSQGRAKNATTSSSSAAEAGDADCGVSGFCYQITNKQSPLGSQHCQELDNPGGTASKYWADRGWKYTSPPWKNGTCDRNLFNFVNKVTHNLDGYDDVTFWYLGIQK
jgi:hypothetical protein